MDICDIFLIYDSHCFYSCEREQWPDCWRKGICLAPAGDDAFHIKGGNCVPDWWVAGRKTYSFIPLMHWYLGPSNQQTDGRDVFLRFCDQQFRRSRVFLDFLSMDGDEVSHATMCPTVQCPSCWCPRDQLDCTDNIYPLRNTQDVYEETAAERKRLLHPNGQPRQGCKQQVSICQTYIIYTLTIFNYSEWMSVCIIKVYT